MKSSWWHPHIDSQREIYVLTVAVVGPFEGDMLGFFEGCMEAQNKSGKHEDEETLQNTKRDFGYITLFLTTSVRLLEGEIVGFPVNKPSHLQTVGASVGCVNMCTNVRIVQVQLKGYS